MLFYIWQKSTQNLELVSLRRSLSIVLRDAPDVCNFIREIKKLINNCDLNENGSHNSQFALTELT